jgi:hypothetical protein
LTMPVLAVFSLNDRDLPASDGDIEDVTVITLL